MVSGTPKVSVGLVDRSLEFFAGYRMLPRSTGGDTMAALTLGLHARAGGDDRIDYVYPGGASKYDVDITLTAC